MVFRFIWHDMAAWFPQFQGFLEQSYSTGTGLDTALWNALLLACAFSLSPLVALLRACVKIHVGSWENPAGWGG